MFDLIAQVLAAFYALPGVGGSYGIAIILLTIAVMILLMPLTLKATRSTIKMQQVQPELKRIQKEHKGDRETLNAELMALYQEQGINPIGGCIPMLAQLPVFLVLFRVLQGLSRRLNSKPYFDVANQVRERSGLEPLSGETFWPQYLSPDTQMYKDLSMEETMDFGPFDLAARAIDVVRDNFVDSLPYIVLILFVVGTSYFQQRQVSARRGDEEVSPVMAQQQMLLKTLPLLSGVWSFLFPAGLVLYWATSNVFRIGQQAYITHQIYGREGAAEALADSRREADDDEGKSAKSDAGKSGAGKSGAPGKKPTGKKTPTKKTPTKKTPSESPKPPGSKAEAVEATDNDGAKTAASNGSSTDRAAAWQRRKQQKAKSKPSTRSTPSSTSRVTPKGTTPNRSKKKRKR